MNIKVRLLGLLITGTVVVGFVLPTHSRAQGQQPSPRPGLTAQQTKQAVELAKGAMKELRKKTEGAVEPDADQREYVVNIELLNRKEDSEFAAPEKTSGKSDEKTKSPGPRAVVTSYRYFDDITVFSTIDLESGRVVDMQAAQHIPTPLSEDEFEEAVAVAREKSDEIKKLYEKFGAQLRVYPQFSQFTVKDDPRFHRVVHLNYRIGKHDLSYPRPQVDLTSRVVVTPPPEAVPKTPIRTRERNPQ